MLLRCSIHKVLLFRLQIQRPRKTLADDELVADQVVVSMTDMSIKTRMRNILDAVHMGGDYER